MVKPSQRTQRSISRSPTSISLSKVRLSLLLTTSFLFGLALCSALFTWQTRYDDPLFLHNPPPPPQHFSTSAIRKPTSSLKYADLNASAKSSLAILDGLRVLVTIASYDFMQLPHLEEVLDGFLDLCYAGSMVDVVIYTTVVYPVALIDMFNDRMRCNNPSPKSRLTVTMILKLPSVRLHLVDFHRTLFYDRIDQYDLFIYTEDDIRVTPKTVAAYLHETKHVESLVGTEHASDFNVGIVRYEYNFPENTVITDKTRHATENVTRVYWEHLGKPIFEKAVNRVEDPALAPFYVSMRLSHQGMYLATPALLKAWKVRPGCRFDEVRDRPSSKKNPSQPTEGTQRVWMSSQMLYGGRHCNVKQLLPVENFGQLTLLHLPNKNYRRVGKQGRLGGNDSSPKNEFSDGTEKFAPPHPDLLKALELHIEMKKQFPNIKISNVDSNGSYRGIRIVDTDFDVRKFQPNHRKLAELRLDAFREYVHRGGYMTESDLNIDDGWRNRS